MTKLFVSVIPILLESRHLTTVNFSALLSNWKEIIEHSSENPGAYSSNGHVRDLTEKKKKKNVT